MDNPRLLLYIALSFILLMIWQAWEQQTAPPPAPVASTPAATADGAAATTGDVQIGRAHV